MLHQIYPNVSDLCWHCHSAKGSLLHNWWECPSVHDFWNMVLQFHTYATGVIVPNTPQITLLSLPPGSYKDIKKAPLGHWLTKAREVIPRHWRLVHAPPLIGLWRWTILRWRHSCHANWIYMINVVKFSSLGCCSGNPLKCEICIRVFCKIGTWSWVETNKAMPVRVSNPG